MTKISVTVILFCVSVHVLSVHITVVLPSVSIALSFLTSTFFLYIFCTHNANTIVTTAGNHSGMAETASEIDVSNISNHCICLSIPITKRIPQITRMMIHSCMPKVLSFFWSGVIFSEVFCTILAIFHNSVCIHVSVTIPVALPVVIVVPEKSILYLSPS